ncbi:MAG: CotH kinase family protein [Pseudomonadota bacterium]|nr:CotH kinase family protein [Pseudomonadota bacterium]
MLSTLAFLLAHPPWASILDQREPESPPADGPGAFLYREGSIHDFRLELSEEAIHALGRDEPDVHALLTYEGATWDVGLKLKGSSTYQSLDGKPSLKIDLEEWVPDQAILGVRRLTLNSMVFDPTMLREHAAYRLYDASGVPAPRHGWARVWINGELYGLYGVVETLDEQWLRRRFPGDGEGNLYDSHYTYADLTGGGVASFELKEGKPVEPYADLRELVRALDSDDILTVLNTRFDRDAVLGMWAVELVIPTWDGYSRNTNNYLLYHATVSDRWYFIPWGQDTAFRGGGSLYAGVRGRMVAACLNHTGCKAALDARIGEVLATWEEIDLVGYAGTAWSYIATDCEEDPRRTLGCDPEDLLGALEERPGQAAGDL